MLKVECFRAGDDRYLAKDQHSVKDIGSVQTHNKQNADQRSGPINNFIEEIIQFFKMIIKT